MSDYRDDSSRRIEDLIRHIIEQAEKSDGKPVFIGMKIFIPASGNSREDPPITPVSVRGDSTEPEIEIHRVRDHIMLVTELPGMSPENIQVLFRDDRVFIWAKDGERQYRASAEVPPAEKESTEISFRNGVLEVRYTPADRCSGTTGTLE
jgi:HSP20 family molecular chaperone IbpA